MSHFSRSRRRVIDQEGRPVPVVSEGAWARLRYSVVGTPSEPDEPVRVALPATPPRLALPSGASATRTLPVVGHGVIALRVPSAPRPAQREFPPSLFADHAFTTGLAQMQMQVHHDGYELARLAERRMAWLLERSAWALARVHAWAAEADGRALEDAYAQGGTGELVRMTPEVLASMDARAMAGAGVAA